MTRPCPVTCPSPFRGGVGGTERTLTEFIVGLEIFCQLAMVVGQHVSFETARSGSSDRLCDRHRRRRSRGLAGAPDWCAAGRLSLGLQRRVARHPTLQSPDPRTGLRVVSVLTTVIPSHWFRFVPGVLRKGGVVMAKSTKKPGRSVIEKRRAKEAKREARTADARARERINS